jgi:hypothetical protein
VHGSAGRASNRAKPKKMRTKVVRLIRQKYSGEVGERFGPTLAAEHLGSEDQIELSATTVRRWMWQRGCGAAKERCGSIGKEELGARTSENWCNSTAASMNGWNNAARAAA